MTKPKAIKHSHKALDLHRDKLLARLDKLAGSDGATSGTSKVRTLLTRHFLTATLPQRAELVDTAAVMIRALEEIAFRL